MSTEPGYFAKTISFFFILALFNAGLAQAKHKPALEFGLIAGGFTTPQYEGSRERYTIPFIWPYFIYRGDNLRVDRAGVRKTFFNSERTSIDLGFSLDLPVYSENVKVRKGMPDIPFMGQLGPRLNYELNPGEHRVKFLIRVPLRGVMNIRGQYSGWLAEPNLVTSVNSFDERVASYLIWGVIWTSGEYNQIFYDVEQKDTNPDRPEFRSGSGLHSVYITLVTIFSLTTRVKLGGYLKWRDLGVGVVSKSPLIEKRTNYSSGFILTWSFWASEERAAHERLVDKADEDIL